MFAVADTVAAFTVAYILFAEKVGVIPIIVVTAASLLPDWLETPWYIFFAHQKKQEPAKEEKKSEDSVVGLGSLFG